uniref:Uncharacterized protein n=1 Tax=Arundo donax TaxID=35708 RepID=A0A0A9BA37_ARUDO
MLNISCQIEILALLICSDF